MKTSIIVPIYRAEAYLDACVKSILAQTDPDFELILVDDGSPDACPALCDEWATRDPRIVVLHKENGGPSEARNLGIEVARGEYLTFIDSDDLVHPAYLDELHRALADGGADIALTPFLRFPEKELPPAVTPSGRYTVLDGRAACLSLCERKVDFIIVCAKLYRRACFDTLRFPKGRLNEDEAVSHHLLWNASRVAVLDSPLYFYRTTPGSIMTSGFSNARFDMLYAFEERLAFFTEKGEKTLASLTKKTFDTTRAILTVRALGNRSLGEMPRRYRMFLPRALLRFLAALTPDERRHVRTRIKEVLTGKR